MWNWSRDSSNHGGKKESYNKIALALLGRDDGRFLILCFNLVKSLTRIIKICLASLGAWENILKSLGLGVDDWRLTDRGRFMCDLDEGVGRLGGPLS